MRDQNGIELQEGLFIKLTGCKVKNDNDIYVIDKDYNTNPNTVRKNEYCLKKVKVNGEKKTSGYTIYFLNGNNPQKKDENLQFEVVTDLKKAKKEVAEYLKCVTDTEIVYLFQQVDTNELEKGLCIKFIKAVKWQGRLNAHTGRYIIESSENGVYSLHILGEKGGKVAYNVNNMYQYTPITLTLKQAIIDQLFIENYIIVEERYTTTKGEIKANKQENTIAEITTIEDVKEPINDNNELEKVDIITDTETYIKQSEVKETVEQNSVSERKYYSINEDQARTAKTLNSFYDYQQNSTTNSYINECDRVYDIADAVAKKNLQNKEQAYTLARKYARLYADWINKKNSIDSMCPSVMICGAGNFPVKKKEKQNSRLDAHFRYYNDVIKPIPDKIEGLIRNSGIIKSNDSNAIKKLEQKLEQLEESQNKMKQANLYWKKNGTLTGFELMSVENCAKINEHMRDGRHDKPFNSYSLTNNNAKIQNTKARLEELKKCKDQGTVEQTEKYNTEDICKVVENTEQMRLQLLFDGKPSEEVRTVLKKNGFRWSPKNSAWQKQLTDNARYSLKRVIADIKELTA